MVLSILKSLKITTLKNFKQIMKFTVINNLIQISSKLNCHLTLIADGTMKIVFYQTKHVYNNVDPL